MPLSNAVTLELPPPPYTNSDVPLSPSGAVVSVSPVILGGPLERHDSPPPSYDAVTPAPDVKERRKSARSLLPWITSKSPPTEQELLASLLRVHPWRRSWGHEPRTLSQALCQTARIGHEELVRSLLGAGAEIRYTGRYAASKSSSPVHEALRGPAPELAGIIVAEFWGRVYAAHHGTARGTGGEGRGNAVDSPAVSAADEKTRYLLDARDSEGCTPLHVAAGVGEEDAVQELLWRGADVEAVDDLGRTPLHMAARFGKLETARFLVQRGACNPGAICEDLWVRAGPRAPELGVQELVFQLLDEVTDDASQIDRPHDIGAEGSGAHAMRSGRAFSSGAADPSPEGLSEARRLSLARSIPTALPTVFATENPESSWLAGAGPSANFASVTPLSLLAEAERVPRRARRPPPTLLYSNEYATWRRQCEKVEAEHKAQKERDRIAWES